MHEQAEALVRIAMLFPGLPVVTALQQSAKRARNGSAEKQAAAADPELLLVLEQSLNLIPPNDSRWSCSCSNCIMATPGTAQSQLYRLIRASRACTWPVTCSLSMSTLCWFVLGYPRFCVSSGGSVNSTWLKWSWPLLLNLHLGRSDAWSYLSQLHPLLCAACVFDALQV